MADQSKAERLAAARKKLQDFQRKKENHFVPSSNVFGVANEPCQTGSTVQRDEQSEQHSDEVEARAKLSAPSVTPHLPQESSDHIPLTGAQEMIHTSDYQQSVNGTQYAVSDEHTLIQGNFFDSVASDTNLSETPSVFSASSYFGNFGGATNESFASGVSNNQPGMQAFFSPTQEVSVHSTAHLFTNSNDRFEKWDTSLASSTGPAAELANSYGTEMVTHEKQLSEYHHQNIKHEHSSAEQVPRENCPRELSENTYEVQTTALPKDDVNIGGKEKYIPLNERSSTESIRQLSDQITHLIDPSSNEEKKLNSSFISSLEARNQELAAQLAAEHSKNQQLQFALKESQSQVSHMELKVQELQSQQEVVLTRHLGPLQEQLRAHAQTVGILVGEKTELEAAIAHHTTTAKQHSSEVEELQNRLRASRHRVSELEKDLASAVAAASIADKQKNNHGQEVDQLRLQNGMLSKQLEDAEEEASELRQKLSSRVTEVNTLSAQLQEKQSQLSLAQLRITQLSASDNPEASAEIESLHQLKISLERRCSELTEAVRQMTADRDQADQQYQQYVAQLNGQLQVANSKLESLSVENEKLKSREEDLVRNMSELERQLQQQIQLQQQLQHNKVQLEVVQQAEQHQDSQSHLHEKIVELEEERQKLLSSLNFKVEELASLQESVEEKDVRITELETLCSERPDQSRLLAAMESDKVAAAQATSQNAVLKQQLQELQDGFIKMSNDKLNLTESLEHEKHVNKEMGEKISQLAEELHELRVLVSDKERRLQEYREHADNHDQNCNDSHEHSHNHSHEMKEANNQIHEKKKSTSTSILQESIHNLNSQNNSLRQLIAQKSTESHESGSSSSATEGATTDEAAAADHETNCEDLSGRHADYRYMQYAMEKLQERFTRTMSEVAELTDEKQRLEHLVLQLQGETETIGEYVTLYQTQRAALQQRAREKDHQLANLSAEREELRRKLQELNQLVHRLLQERVPETGKDALSSLEVLSENAVNQIDSGVIEVPNVPEAVGQETNTNQDVAKRLSKKILAIIEDINVSSDLETSFHPCPWCSGRLKNV